LAKEANAQQTEALRWAKISGKWARMAKRPRSKPDLVDRLCAAVRHLTAERAARSNGPQFIMNHTVARHLGINTRRPSGLWRGR